LAEIAGERVYVPLTLPGERVEIERDGPRARLVSIITPSPDRVAPLCRHFGTCGTCALEHLAPESYRAWKRDLVVTAFAQRGIEAPVDPIVALAPGTRRRAIFSALRSGNGALLGFHRRQSDTIVPVSECAVLVPAIVRKLDALASIAALALPPRKPGRVTVIAADNGLDVAIVGGAKPDRRMLEALGRFGADPAFARLTVDGSEIFQARRPEIAVDGAALYPTAGGFLQAAAPAEKAMAEATLAHVGDARPVADLFSGIGTFTLRLARRAPVTAVEGEATLLAALDMGVRHAKGLKPVTTRKRDLFRNPMAPIELNAFGAVVFDPPAAGAKAQAEALAASRVPKVVAVSCNPATLARDARILIDGGYRLTRVLPIDQFLFSSEVEAVATFER
ncbi:MAG: class I SAM-dependent RNA methyltransferase, partial [Rhizobiales bacterium]|nr:class I SAM-dependent RNA methyltransferase [Hyphomicrobiales bacterium]